MSYVHYARNGLVTYVHSSVQHQLLQTSTDDYTTFQLIEVIIGSGRIRLCNVYAAPGRLNVAAIPSPGDRCMVHMGDFNARHPALGDCSGTEN